LAQWFWGRILNYEKFADLTDRGWKHDN